MPAVALADPEAAERAAASWKGRVLAGEEGIRELVAPRGADLVLNAIVGSAGLGPTIVALTEGIDLALANKESLVVGGELVTALAEATGARIIPVDSEHSALHQLSAAETGNGRATRADSLRRAVPGPHRPSRCDPRGGARPPHLGDGRQDHDRLRHADQQGPRGDRGASPVRGALRADRGGRPPAVDRPRDGAAQRRRVARPSRAIPTCACRSPTRFTTPSAPTSPSALDLAEVGELTFEAPTWTRSRACAWPVRRARRGGPRRRAERGQRDRRRGLPEGPDPVHRDRGGGGGNARSGSGDPARPLRRPVRGGCAGPRARPASSSSDGALGGQAGRTARR